MGISERKEREKEQRRNEILDAAEKVFFSKGVWAATMDDVAEAAELSKGTLYLYFKNRDELYYGITGRGLAILNDLFKKAVEKGRNGLEKTFLIGTAFLQFSQEHTDYFNALSYYEIKDVDFSNASSMACQCDAYGNEAIGLLIQAIRTGIEDGSIRKDVDPFNTAIVLWGQTAGIIQLVTTKGKHLEKHHGFPMGPVVEESFRLMRCMLEPEEKPSALQHTTRHSKRP
jgi:AcrR family transcriptional regulator